MSQADSSASGEEIALRINQDYKRHGGYVVTTCYNTASHSQGDRKPSLTIYDGNKGYYCYACGESGTHSWLLKQFGIEDERYAKKTNSAYRAAPKKATPPPKKDYKQYPLADIYASLSPLPSQAIEILEAKGFKRENWENVAGWRWHEGQVQGWPNGVFIPYFLKGEIVTARLRALEGAVRFFSLPGGESFGFCMDELEKPRVYVCEGETDTMTLNFLGFPAVGVPGSTNAEAIRKIISMATHTRAKLIVVPDNDEAGAKFLERIQIEAFENNIAVEVFELPGYKDVNEWFSSVGEEAFTSSLLASMETDIFADLPPVYVQTKIMEV